LAVEAAKMSNLDAFLTTIAISEGTEFIGDRGYNCIVGSTPAHPHLFDSYADHPRIAVRLSPTLVSTAAGRYQILERFYDAYRTSLHLPDFSPASQDAIATQMIRERHALEDVMAGRLESAVAKCSNIWASLPGNDYGQHQNTLASLHSAYLQAGGLVA
jgi:muramidase (phage lysozyme)